MNYRLIYLLGIFLFACNAGTTDKKETESKLEIPAQVLQQMDAVKQSPDSLGLRFKLADALDSVGAYKLALAQMDSLTKRDGANFGFWYKTAQILEHAKDSTAAIHAYATAARIYPSPDALLALANLYAEKKDSAALRLCKQVADLRLGRAYLAHCNFISGIYYARTGNNALALTLFNQCIANNYTYMEAYMEKGFLYFDSKQYPEALKVFQTVVTLKNVYPDGYYWLGKCYETMQNKALAIENYEKAFSLDNQLIEASAAIKKLKMP